MSRRAPQRGRSGPRRQREEGSVLILTIGFAVVIMLLVAVVVDASKLFLTRRALASVGREYMLFGHLLNRAGLPPVHVALVRANQLVPRLEDYIAHQRANGLTAFTEGSNVVLLTGASRTADIEMNVVYGVHGPLELHVILMA